MCRIAGTGVLVGRRGEAWELPASLPTSCPPPVPNPCAGRRMLLQTGARLGVLCLGCSWGCTSPLVPTDTLGKMDYFLPAVTLAVGSGEAVFGLATHSVCWRRWRVLPFCGTSSAICSSAANCICEALRFG